ncbi:MAG: DUF86 domain-containing protein [bacterium]|nr:DUF86 domain-containing protein [bacterium]
MSNYKELVIRLEKLREYLKILKELKEKCALADFKRDNVLRGALERYLQLSAEAAIDIGEIIISELMLETPMSHKEIFEIMGKEKIIPPLLAVRFCDIAKFRNILVHDYVKLDLEKMYDYLRNDLADFKKYIIAIAKFIKKFN